MSFVSWFNNPSPSAAHMRQWIRSALVRMMACRLFAPGLCLGQCWVIVNWNRFQFVSCFNHLPLVPHIWVSELVQHWFGWWLVAYSAPGHCLGQCWVTVNWNRLQLVFCFNHLLLVPRMRQWIRSALVRMMACRLFAPGLCLGQCWVIVNWNRFQLVFCFNHLPLVPHICVSESGQHCFGWWLIAYSVPGLCLGQCWVIVNWNRLQFVFCFNHLLLVSHICVGESGQHWLGWWLVAYSSLKFGVQGASGTNWFSRVKGARDNGIWL